MGKDQLDQNSFIGSACRSAIFSYKNCLWNDIKKSSPGVLFPDRRDQPESACENAYLVHGMYNILKKIKILYFLEAISHLLFQFNVREVRKNNILHIGNVFIYIILTKCDYVWINRLK